MCAEKARTAPSTVMWGVRELTEERVLRRRSWPVLNGIFIAAVWGIYPWGVRASMEHGYDRDVWVATAVFCAVTALFLRLGTCAVVLRAESLVVRNPIGAKEVRYDGIRRVVAGAGGSLRVLTVRDESLSPAVFGGSLVDRMFGTSEKAALEIRQRMPRTPRSAAKAEPVKRTLVRRCRPADLFLALALLAGIGRGVVGLIN